MISYPQLLMRNLKLYRDSCLWPVRNGLRLRRPKRHRKLPQLLSEPDLKRFFRAIQECGDVEHEIMLRFLFFTSIRVSELVNIKVKDVDLGGCKVFVDQGKGSKDRYIPDLVESSSVARQKPLLV